MALLLSATFLEWTSISLIFDPSSLLLLHDKNSNFSNNKSTSATIRNKLAERNKKIAFQRSIFRMFLKYRLCVGC